MLITERCDSNQTRVGVKEVKEGSREEIQAGELWSHPISTRKHSRLLWHGRYLVRLLGRNGILDTLTASCLLPTDQISLSETTLHSLHLITLLFLAPAWKIRSHALWHNFSPKTRGVRGQECPWSDPKLLIAVATMVPTVCDEGHARAWGVSWAEAHLSGWPLTYIFISNAFSWSCFISYIHNKFRDWRNRVEIVV